MTATVTVVIPFYGPEEFLIQCVESLLNQTHKDLTILIIGDGIPVPEFSDSRVVSYSLPDNRGTYFCRQVGLLATRTEWLAVMDADDWAEPTWIQEMMDLAVRDNLDMVHSSTRFQIEDDGAHVVRPFPKARHTTSPVMLRHITSHVGLYRANVLRAIGGYNPGQRFGWDTLLVSMLRRRVRWGLIDTPLWHRRRHPEAMTRRPDTRPDSPARLRNQSFLQMVYRKAQRVPDPGKYLHSLFPPELVAEVEFHALQVFQLLPLPPESVLPRVLHTFWGGPEMPESISGFIETWRNLNPGWTVKVWTDSDVRDGKLRLSREELTLYRNPAKFSPVSNEWQYKSNIARLRMLYQFGGVWFDADFEALKPLDALVEKYAPFVCRENPKFVNNGLLAFPAKHPFIAECLKTLPRRIRENPDQRSNWQNGPHLYTEVLNNHPGVNVVPTELVYPLTYSQARRGLSAKDVDLSKAVAVHHWGNVRRQQGRPLE